MALLAHCVAKPRVLVVVKMLDVGLLPTVPVGLQSVRKQGDAILVDLRLVEL